MVILQGEVPPGEFVPVKIDGALTYDLTGQVEINLAGDRVTSARR